MIFLPGKAKQHVIYIKASASVYCPALQLDATNWMNPYFKETTYFKPS